MIYKFIDNNGSEITVNSLSSLQALADSDTINEDTKVKAGLRGKWTTASAIEELVFSTVDSNENNQDNEAPQGDIKSFITGEEKKESSPHEAKYVEEIVEDEVEVDDDTPEEIDQQEEDKSNADNENKNQDTSDYYTEKFNKSNEDDEDKMVLSFSDAVKKCFKKYFDFKGRASRSEYWYFTLFIVLGYAIGFGLIFVAAPLFWLLMIFIAAVIIPWISVAARRLHDINKSGWFQAIPIPAGILEAIFAESRKESLEIIFLIIGLLCYVYLIILLCTAGGNEENRFGKNPLKNKLDG